MNTTTLGMIIVDMLTILILPFLLIRNDQQPKYEMSGKDSGSFIAAKHAPWVPYTGGCQVINSNWKSRHDCRWGESILDGDFRLRMFLEELAFGRFTWQFQMLTYLQW